MDTRSKQSHRKMNHGVQPCRYCPLTQRECSLFQFISSAAVAASKQTASNETYQQTWCYRTPDHPDESNPNLFSLHLFTHVFTRRGIYFTSRIMHDGKCSFLRYKLHWMRWLSTGRIAPKKLHKPYLSMPKKATASFGFTSVATCHWSYDHLANNGRLASLH